MSLLGSSELQKKPRMKQKLPLTIRSLLFKSPQPSSSSFSLCTNMNRVCKHPSLTSLCLVAPCNLLRTPSLSLSSKHASPSKVGQQVCFSDRNANKSCMLLHLAGHLRENGASSEVTHSTPLLPHNAVVILLLSPPFTRWSMKSCRKAANLP